MLSILKSKINLPWRDRQRPPSQPWWAKFLASRAVWAGIGAAASFLLMHGVQSLENARKLPSEVAATYNSFLSWYFDDAVWTGTWSSREEGNVEDFNQANVPIKLSIETIRGKANGEMFNPLVCALSPLLPPVLVEGEITRGRLIGYAYAYVGGKKEYLYSFIAAQSATEPVVTLSPIKDPLKLVPSSARLVRRIDEATPASAAAGAAIIEHPDLECPESSVEYIQRLRREGKLEALKLPNHAHPPLSDSR